MIEVDPQAHFFLTIVMMDGQEHVADMPIPEILLMFLAHLI